jgi:hypothetical protein
MSPHTESVAGDCAGCPREAACRALRNAALHFEAFARVCRGSSVGTAAREFDAVPSRHPEEPTAC